MIRETVWTRILENNISTYPRVDEELLINGYNGTFIGELRMNSVGLHWYEPISERTYEIIPGDCWVYVEDIK